MTDPEAAADAFRKFVEVIRALRTPGTGCPWDLEQDHRTLRPYLLEEAHEVLEAIDRGDDPALRDELGDLLLQVVLHSQVAADRGAFAIDAVIRRITEKMIRRHPHVFGDERAASADEVRASWERIKAQERAEAGAPAKPEVPVSLPALLRAQRLMEKAGSEPDVALGERLAALEQQAAKPSTAAKQADAERALGALLLEICRLANRLGVVAEDALRVANQRLVDEGAREKAV